MLVIVGDRGAMNVLQKVPAAAVGRDPGMLRRTCGRRGARCSTSFTTRISRAGMGNEDGVAPHQALVTSRVGAVVGDGDVPGFGDCGLRQCCAQIPVGVADVGEVVHDVFADIRDADGHRTVGQESACP